MAIFKSKKNEYELELISFILKKFGYKPKDLRYFLKAITHKSFRNQEIDFSNDYVDITDIFNLFILSVDYYPTIV
jgi:dsRNA-specific ribonuclease